MVNCGIRSGQDTLMTEFSLNDTYTGNKGLVIEENLIFEQDTPELTGVDWPDVNLTVDKLGGLQRKFIGLPGLSEPEVVRHYTRLSQKNYSIDTGLYPLGSCTMKHNPRINEKVARFFSDIHPLQPQSSAQGALEVIFQLSQWLMALTGLPAVAMSPAAGAHGELCGLMIIKAALESRGENRSIILVPESAHGTNPATAAACGFSVRTIKCNDNGLIDLDSLKEALSSEVAAIMLTNPNTCGLFETDIIEVAELIHNAGAYFYCDGANFNAIMGKVRPADLGIDCMHINLHKTFSTPHGGGGPGSGPVVLSKDLAPFAPIPFVVKISDNEFQLVEHLKDAPQSIGRIKGFHGQMGMFIRALAYMKSHGADGLRQVAEDAVLNANYILSQLKDILSPSYEGYCMHEALFDERFLAGTGISALDFTKALIDEGFHPMTMYFPLVVNGALLVEPTECESKATLDLFIGALKHLAKLSKQGNKEYFAGAPYYTPRRRLDETRAARQHILRWSKNEQEMSHEIRK